MIIFLDELIGYRVNWVPNQVPNDTECDTDNIQNKNRRYILNKNIGTKQLTSICSYRAATQLTLVTGDPNVGEDCFIFQIIIANIGKLILYTCIFTWMVMASRGNDALS